MKLQTRIVSDDLRGMSRTTKGRPEWDQAAADIRAGKTVWIGVDSRQSLAAALQRRGLPSVRTHKHEGGFVVWLEAE